MVIGKEKVKVTSREVMEGDYSCSRAASLLLFCVKRKGFWWRGVVANGDHLLNFYHDQCSLIIIDRIVFPHQEYVLPPPTHSALVAEALGGNTCVEEETELLAANGKRENADTGESRRNLSTGWQRA